MTQYPSLENKKNVSILDLQAMKQKGEKIACLTAYDASFSAVLDQAGIDLILVGDSLGMVIQGKDTTIPVLIDEIVYHTQCVTQAKPRAFIVADLPFLSYCTPETAAQSAAGLMRKGLAQMVKLEGTKPEIIAFLVAQGIPVCGHLGLLPQSINQLGGYRVQGKEKATADKMLSDALKLEQAGASLLILECVPAVLGKKITDQLSIPVIGIGAGIDCDGQVLVLYDILDIGVSHRPKFSKNYLQNASSIAEAVGHYIEEVKQLRFPSSDHTYP
jgi:3-methyl-2-oxobutanoate hydroxymethyltransferase